MTMQCPRCNGSTRVVETFNDVEEMHRRRKCNDCSHAFLTCESEVPMGLVTELRRFKMAKLAAEKQNDR